MTELTAGMLFFAACLLFIGIMCLVNYRRDQKREYVIVCGRVVGQETRRRYRRGMHTVGFTPVFEYTYGGRVYRCGHRVESSKYGKGMKIVPASRYKEGDTVELRVYTDDPAYALVNDKNNIRLPLYMGVPLTVLGCALLGTAVLLIL